MKVTLLPKGIHFECNESESVADAAARAGVLLPVSCRNGVCHICDGVLVKGSVKTGPQQDILECSDAEHAFPLLLCKTRPITACEIEVDNVYGPGELPVKKVICQVLDISSIQAHVYVVRLKLPAGKPPEFFAGQYLSLDIPDKEAPHYFSIASRPGLDTLELHIQADPHLDSAVSMVRYLQDNLSVSVSLPYGRACLPRLPEKSLLMMAAGTGFAQMKSIVEFLIEQGFRHDIDLYWTVRQEQDMYMKDLAEQWAKQHANIRFRSVVADTDDKLGLEHHDQLSEAVLNGNYDLVNRMVFVSGSPRLVFAAQDALTQAGLPNDQFFSDVLEYVSRS